MVLRREACPFGCRWPDTRRFGYVENVSDELHHDAVRFRRCACALRHGHPFCGHGDGQEGRRRHAGPVLYPSYGNAGYAAGQAESGAGHCQWQD